MSRLGGSPPSAKVSVPPRTGSFFVAAVVPAGAAPPLVVPPEEPSSLLPPPQAASSSPPAPPSTALPNSLRLSIAERRDRNELRVDIVSPPCDRSHRRSSCAACLD